MIETIQVTSKFACLYFIAIVVFGTMIFMKLFIAILLTRMNREGYGGKDKKWLKEDMESLARTFDREMDKHEKLYLLMQDAAERAMDDHRNRFKKMWRKNRDRHR